MKIKTAELIRKPLNWAVAVCEGTVGQKPQCCFECKHLEVRSTNEDDDNFCTHPAGGGWTLMEGWGAAVGVHYGIHDSCPITATTAEPYSTDWAQGGPIIEKEEIQLSSSPHSEGYWWYAQCMGSTKEFAGPTPLIAAMRCYVASKLGDEVDVPEGLL